MDNEKIKFSMLIKDLQAPCWRVGNLFAASHLPLLSDVDLGRDFVQSVVSNSSRAHTERRAAREKFEGLCGCDWGERNIIVREDDIFGRLTLPQEGTQRFATIRKDKQHYKTV